MSGTDHSMNADWSGPQPVVILVDPQMGENIGAAARAMWNFGLEHLRLVRPRDGWPNPAAVATASGAARVLDQTNLYPTTDAALSDLSFTFATTARTRDLTKPVLTPQEAAKRARGMIAVGQRVGFIFGPERAGLTNADVARANALISVPVNPAFASLNLAQCVLLLAYEWRQATQSPAPEEPPALASGADVAALHAQLETRLSDAGFFWPEDKAESMALNLRNLISRLPLTPADVRSLHGVIRSLAEKHPKSRQPK